MQQEYQWLKNTHWPFQAYRYNKFRKATLCRWSYRNLFLIRYTNSTRLFCQNRYSIHSINLNCPCTVGGETSLHEGREEGAHANWEDHPRKSGEASSVPSGETHSCSGGEAYSHQDSDLQDDSAQTQRSLIIFRSIDFGCLFIYKCFMFNIVIPYVVLLKRFVNKCSYWF